MKIERLVVGSLQANCYIVSSDKKDAFIIDPGDEADKIKKLIDNNKLKIHFIINTHSHIDHIKADCALGFPVYIHELDAAALENPRRNFSTYLLGDFEACKPAKVLRDGDKIKLGELEMEILHTPGHSPGGICIKIDGVVFTGDTLFRDGIGRTDLPDGSNKAIMSSIEEKLLCLNDNVKIYPGHGEPSTIGRERANF
ncbi:MAG: MBL fold metallo-hydrolase [Candidatus Omnitrophica bacterium]|nr:MBL fold metallo-hydrolase [Candidatus Omnitrophota bacterium]MDD5352809.1 MBL fold metallo-hydrolase [Candidatus Omnitrophota bacterium]MDD5550408.1 MBL fold metallo-hydrolase [Candidatus Omnitrophota bacterium]